VVVDANRSYEEHRAWLGLIGDLRALGRTDEALLELEKLVAASPQLAHVVEQCSALADAGRVGEARELLAPGARRPRARRARPARLANACGGRGSSRARWPPVARTRIAPPGASWSAPQR
jgi:hypothetical protein